MSCVIHYHGPSKDPAPHGKIRTDLEALINKRKIGSNQSDPHHITRSTNNTALQTHFDDADAENNRATREQHEGVSAENTRENDTDVKVSAYFSRCTGSPL